VNRGAPRTSELQRHIATEHHAAADATVDLGDRVAGGAVVLLAPHDALEYAFELPQTDQKCRLVGSTKGVSGFGGNVEVFLLTDNEYLFWHANPAAIAQSSWETFRGSENTLDYDLPSAGAYHFVVSNEMGLSPQTMAVKAQVKCVW